MGGGNVAIAYTAAVAVSGRLALAEAGVAAAIDEALASEAWKRPGVRRRLREAPRDAVVAALDAALVSAGGAARFRRAAWLMAAVAGPEGVGWLCRHVEAGGRYPAIMLQGLGFAVRGRDPSAAAAAVAALQRLVLEGPVRHRAVAARELTHGPILVALGALLVYAGQGQRALRGVVAALFRLGPPRRLIERAVAATVDPYESAPLLWRLGALSAYMGRADVLRELEALGRSRSHRGSVVLPALVRLVTEQRQLVRAAERPDAETLVRASGDPADDQRLLRSAGPDDAAEPEGFLARLRRFFSDD